MNSTIIIIDPKTDGAEIRQANITISGAWVIISCKDIIIKAQADDVGLVIGDEGHG